MNSGFALKTAALCDVVCVADVCFFAISPTLRPPDDVQATRSPFFRDFAILASGRPISVRLLAPGICSPDKDFLQT